MGDYVINVYENEQQAAEAIEEFKKDGYTTDEISVIANKANGLSKMTQEVKTSTMDGAIAGAATGGALGIAGALAGLPAVLVPGLGAILAAGPVLTVLGGALVGARSSEGGLLNSLMNIGISEEDAQQYSNAVEDGKFLVILHAKSS
jgi:uncharacterized membrane protein